MRAGWQRTLGRWVPWRDSFFGPRGGAFLLALPQDRLAGGGHTHTHERGSGGSGGLAVAEEAWQRLGAEALSRVGGGDGTAAGSRGYARGGGAQQSTQPLLGRLLRWLRWAALRAALQAFAKMSPTFSWYLAEHSK